MMETLRLKNYRKFDDTGDIAIKPLTLLIGANSSGKSSFLKFFPLIKQSIRRHPNGVFLWYSDDVDFKDFHNTVREGADEIEIEFSSYEARRDNEGSTYQALVKVKFAIARQSEKRDYLKHFELETGDISIKITFPIEKKGKLFVYLNDREYSIEGANTVSVHPIIPSILFDNGEDRPEIEYSQKVIDYLYSTLNFNENDSLWAIRNAFINRGEIRSTLQRHKLISKKLKEEESWYKIEDYVILYNINRYLESVFFYLDAVASNITYIQPLRAMAERYYRIQNISVEEIDSHGDNLAMYLYSLDKKDQKGFSDWLYELFRFKIKIEPSGGHVEIKIEEYGDSAYKNLVDVGFGYSQMLPILASI